MATQLPDMTSVSPRPLDDLDTDEEPDSWPRDTDPRLVPGFLTLSLGSAGYSSDEHYDDRRVFAATPDPSANRRKRRQRETLSTLDNAEPFAYKTRADGDAFRLATIQPGTGESAIFASLSWEDSKRPRRAYRCLSYAWESVSRDAAILLDGYNFPVTTNLLRALQNLRKPKQTLIVWIDQICINQNDNIERAHQVRIMKHIFREASKIYVWLGESDHRSEKLFEYAKRIRRGEDSPKSVTKRILGPRDLKYAIKDLLERPWFQRVWVIPEVALSHHTGVVCGSSTMTWDCLVRLVRDVQLPLASGFDKQVSLLGNPRQRIAIVTDMIASQKDGHAHTDIAQLLILGKSSKATDVRDMVYAFYGLTYLTTHPDYSRSPEGLFVEIVLMYATSILGSYASWDQLSEQGKNVQLMSILYSAGALHQHYSLPSWVPDWTFSWHLAPVWCKATPNFPGPGNDSSSTGFRSDFRAGGVEHRPNDFEILDGIEMKLSALVFDYIVMINEMTPASTPATSQELPLVPATALEEAGMSELRYGRHFFTTSNGHIGLATPGIDIGDATAILLGGDVPVIIRACRGRDGPTKAYKLLCECWVQSAAVMSGELLRTNWTSVEDIRLV